MSYNIISFYFHIYHLLPSLSFTANLESVCHITSFQKSIFYSFLFFLYDSQNSILFDSVITLWGAILIFIYIIWSGFFFFPSLTIYSFFLTNSHSFFLLFSFPFFSQLILIFRSISIGNN